MIPKRIPIQREENAHTHYIGKYHEGLQYMGFVFFARSHQARPIAVLHLLDTDGNHVKSEAWENEDICLAEEALKKAIEKLPEAKPDHIRARPFSVELNGMKFGLIPCDDEDCVQYVPYGLSFYPPWNGLYDT